MARSEIDLRPELNTTSVGQGTMPNAERRTTLCVHSGAIAGVVAADVGAVESVEQVDREPNRLGRADRVEILAQTEIHVLVWEDTRNGEPGTLIGVRRSRRTEARGAADVLLVLTAERADPRELNAPEVRQVAHRIHDQTMLLVAGQRVVPRGRWMFGDA